MGAIPAKQLRSLRDFPGKLVSGGWLSFQGITKFLFAPPGLQHPQQRTRTSLQVCWEKAPVPRLAVISPTLFRTSIELTLHVRLEPH